MNYIPLVDKGYIPLCIHGYVTVFTNIIWHKAISLEITLFVWRLLHNRIPNKDNYSEEVFLTVTIETANHMFLGCDLFGNINLWY